MNEQQMIQCIDSAKLQVSQILDRTKNPVIASSVDHDYSDKYRLTEFLVNTAVASHLTTLRHFGLTKENLASVHSWARNLSTVSLRFAAEERCSLLRTDVREEDSKSKIVTEGGGFFTPATTKVVTTIKEWVWEFEASWELLAVKGTGADPADSLRLNGRKGKHTLRTTTERPPRPALKAPAVSFDLNITFLLALLKPLEAEAAAGGGGGGRGGGGGGGGGLAPHFAIDRTHVECLTPRRNPQVVRALQWGQELLAWSNCVRQYWQREVVGILDAAAKASLNLAAALDVSSVFVPVLPLFLEGSAPVNTPVDTPGSSFLVRGGSGGGGGGSDDYATLPPASDEAAPPPPPPPSSVVLGLGEVNAFLTEEARGLAEKHSSLASSFPPPTDGGALVSASEAFAMALCAHACQVVNAMQAGCDFVEGMLRSQLATAIGQEVTPADFSAYMTFHYRQHLFQAPHAPKPFCHSVRRTPTHSPEGTVSIEFSPGAAGAPGAGGSGGVAARPIETMSCARPFCNDDGSGETMMGFSINSSTRVSFSGERHLHAWLRFDFSGDDGTKPTANSGNAHATTAGASLVCRARQFSSFVVLIGRLSDGATLDPTSAFVVQNRDELSVPLELATLPTPKAFRDAIASLSPEQQRFAKAFRELQLNSTLFGVCVVQVKPQLEAVLNLPPDSLTKEIKLTQDLMELFVDFQISADLLSYDAAADSSSSSSNRDNTAVGGEAAAGVSVSAKLAAVKAHVAAMNEMIGTAKNEEVAARRQEHAYAHPDFLAAPPQVQQQQAMMAQPESMDMMSMEMMGGGGGFGAPPMMARRSSGVKAKGQGGGGRGGAPILMSRMAGAAPPPPPASAAAPSSSSAAAAVQASAQAPKRKLTNVEQEQQPRSELAKAKEKGEEGGGGDLTKVAKEMDSRYEALDPSAALRPTIITPGATWLKKAQGALLASKKPPTTTSLGEDGQASEKAKAFDLLDALSRSGALPLKHSSLHVVVCATHAFDDSVVDTVVCKNVNPIERAERSALIMAAAVHGLPSTGTEGYSALVKPESIGRVAELSPLLFGGAAGAAASFPALGAPADMARSSSDLLLG
jgi:hypothetical protein